MRLLSRARPLRSKSPGDEGLRRILPEIAMRLLCAMTRALRWKAMRLRQYDDVMVVELDDPEELIPMEMPNEINVSGVLNTLDTTCNTAKVAWRIVGLDGSVLVGGGGGSSNTGGGASGRNGGYSCGGGGGSSASILCSARVPI